MFVALNMMNIRLGEIIQSLFISFKSIPILSAVLAGAYFTRASSLSTSNLHYEGLPFVLPLVLYAAVGFEAACSLSSKIKDAQKNASRVVLISFGLVICIAALYQLFFYGALGQALGQLPNYRYAFPALFSLYNLPSSVYDPLITIFHVAIACSALGGSYGIIFSNSWNLYTLAINKHTVCASTLTAENRYHIPSACIVVEGIICLGYLALTGGSQLLLQPLSALGCTVAYLISIISLQWLYIKEQASLLSHLITIGAFLSCLLLLGACINTLYFQNAGSLLTFVLLLLCGLSMFFYTQRKEQQC
jgi:amino acid transporter